MTTPSRNGVPQTEQPGKLYGKTACTKQAAKKKRTKTLSTLLLNNEERDKSTAKNPREAETATGLKIKTTMSIAEIGQTASWAAPTQKSTK